MTKFVCFHSNLLCERAKILHLRALNKDRHCHHNHRRSYHQKNDKLRDMTDDAKSADSGRRGNLAFFALINRFCS